MASRMANLVCFYEVFGVYAVMCNMISVMNGISTSALVLARLLGLGELGSALEILWHRMQGGTMILTGSTMGICSAQARSVEAQDIPGRQHRLVNLTDP
jgi:hypothetical protein